MSAELQTLLALLAVAIAAVWLVRRAFRQSKTPGCGGGCGCPAQDGKSKLAKLARH